MELTETTRSGTQISICRFVEEKSSLLWSTQKSGRNTRTWFSNTTSQGQDLTVWRETVALHNTRHYMDTRIRAIAVRSGSAYVIKPIYGMYTECRVFNATSSLPLSQRSSFRNTQYGLRAAWKSSVCCSYCAFAVLELFASMLQYGCVQFHCPSVKMSTAALVVQA